MRTFALLVAVLLSCRTVVVHAQTRRYQEGSFKEIVRIDKAHGFELASPQMLVLSGNSLLVYDAGSRTILSFSRGGRFQWEAGRNSSGNTKLNGPSSLIGDGNGGALVVDDNTFRITTIASDGTITDRRFAQDEIRRIAITSSNRVLVAPPSGVLVGYLDEHGALTHTAPLPSVKGKPERAVTDQLLSPLESGNIVATFAFSTEALLLDAKLKRIRRFSLVDSQPFPAVVKVKPFPNSNRTAWQVDPNATPVIRSISTTHDTLYVVDERTTTTQPAVDLYVGTTGEYVGSRLLPSALRIVRVDGDLMFGMTAAPFGSVAVYRWESGAKH